jgi:hypothetical protein
MGMMKFHLPADLSGETLQELERTCVAGGQDNMPFPTQVLIESGEMTVIRGIDESGCLFAPWEVNGSGQVMAGSATLMERTRPYQLLIELARGKLHQVRGQVSDWVMGGLRVTEPLADQIHAATEAFVRAVAGTSSNGDVAEAKRALAEGYRAADLLTQTYISQVFQLRHERQPALDTALGCRLTASLANQTWGPALEDSFNSVCLPFNWDQIEPAEGDYSWDTTDALVDWGQIRGLRLQGGPILDFTGQHFPDWFWRRKRDLATLSGLLCNYVETVIDRYRDSVRTWQITTASNAAQLLASGDEELLWLTVRAAEAVRQIDPSLEIILGIAQPWGEYLVGKEHTHSPFVFADTLARSGLKLAALDLELVMGVTPRGSYCRDLLDASRLIDLYALLGAPLQITLGYPSSAGPDAHGAADQVVSGGHWRGGFSPAVQAEWAAEFAALALCKPSVRAVHWAHASDAETHIFPHCGLIDDQGNVKPVLENLRVLRKTHLK